MEQLIIQTMLTSVIVFVLLVIMHNVKPVEDWKFHSRYIAGLVIVACITAIFVGFLLLIWL